MDFGAVLIAVCGLTVVLVGLILFGILFLVRKSGIDLFDTMGAMTEVFGGNEDGGPEPQTRRGRRDLRSRAQSLDFDSALARHTGQAPPSAVNAAQQATPPPLDLDSPAPGLDGRRDRRDSDTRASLRRRRRERGDQDDEIFGGMLDEDGDGRIDF